MTEPIKSVILDAWPRWERYATIYDLWPLVEAWTSREYRNEIERLHESYLEPVTPEKFWREYVWCVLVAGFNANVISGLFDRLMDALGRDPYAVVDSSRSQVFGIFSNLRKISSIYSVARMIKRYPSFDAFHHDLLRDIDSMMRLSGIGPVAKHHLARNLGIDTVKPDLHLMRLAKKFGYESPKDLCVAIAHKYNYKYLGEVDMRLFYYCQAYGTLELEAAA